MELLNKVNLRFLVLLIAVFLVAGIILFIGMGYVVDKNLDEILTNRATKVVEALKRDSDAQYAQFKSDQSLTITRISSTPDFRQFSDTIAYDVLQHENVEYRKITYITSVSSITYKIEIILSRLEIEDMIQLIFYFMFGLLIIIVVILYFLNHKLSSSLWHPFFHSLDQLKDFRLNQKKQIRLDDTSIVEFQQMNDAIADLIQKVQHDFIILKEFTENASHEIQTPLAIIKLKAESILQDESVILEHRRKLEVILESASRLSKLNETLLLLSKIENQQFIETTTVDLSQLAKEKLDFIEELLYLKNIHATFGVQSSFVLIINAYLAEVLIGNLIGNALKHTPENGEIFIMGDENKLIFSNSGRPLTIEKDKIFNRFVKQSEAGESSGLGLSIAMEICRNYKIDLTYNYDNDLHCFYLIKKQ